MLGYEGKRVGSNTGASGQLSDRLTTAPKQPPSQRTGTTPKALLIPGVGHFHGIDSVANARSSSHHASIDSVGNARVPCLHTAQFSKNSYERVDDMSLLSHGR